MKNSDILLLTKIITDGIKGLSNFFTGLFLDTSKEKQRLKELQENINLSNQKIKLNKQKLKSLRKKENAKVINNNIQSQKIPQNTELQEDNIIFYIAQHHYKFYNYECEFEELYHLFIRMIERIETKLGIKLKLMQILDGADVEMEKELEELTSEDECERELINIDKIGDYLNGLDFSSITETISVKITGKKTKNEYFFNSKNQMCSTENAVKDYLETQGYNVLYCENNFWIPIAVLAFAEEIYSKGWQGIQTTPITLFRKDLSKLVPEFYDRKLEYIKTCNLDEFIKEQIQYFGFINDNIFRCQGTDYIDYIIKNGSGLLKAIPNSYFLHIITNILNKHKIYGRGLPDLCAWNQNEFCFVEVKRQREKIREAQQEWITFFKTNNIPIKIIRVKGIKN